MSDTGQLSPRLHQASPKSVTIPIMTDSQSSGFSQTGFKADSNGYSQGDFQPVLSDLFRNGPQQQEGFSQSGFRDEHGNLMKVPEAFNIPASASREKRPAPVQPKKRIIICCDGTWQSSAHGTQTIPSNVAKISRSIASWYVDENGLKAPQLVYYDAGVGTAMGWLEAKWTGEYVRERPWQNLMSCRSVWWRS
jgi:hypothetical protein